VLVSANLVPGLTIPDMRVWKVVPVLVLLVAACSPQTESAAPSTTTPSVSTSTAPTTTLPLVAGCPEDGEFTEGGHVNTVDQPSSSDADTIGLISWAAEESCETFTVSFETSEGAPATTPPSVVVEYIDDVPVVRMALATERTVITDQLVETPMVDRLYVVNSIDGGMFIDFHLASPAQARITVESSPARVLLDLQPGIVDYPNSVAASDFMVVVTPVDASTETSPVSIEGYGRTFESNVLLIATAGDEVVAEDFTTATDSESTWGEFATQMTLPPGDVSLFVGDENQEQGGLEGVTVTLTVQ